MAKKEKKEEQEEQEGTEKAEEEETGEGEGEDKGKEEKPTKAVKTPKRKVKKADFESKEDRIFYEALKKFPAFGPTDPLYGPLVGTVRREMSKNGMRFNRYNLMAFLEKNAEVLIEEV